MINPTDLPVAHKRVIEMMPSEHVVDLAKRMHSMLELAGNRFRYIALVYIFTIGTFMHGAALWKGEPTVYEPSVLAFGFSLFGAVGFFVLWYRAQRTISRAMCRLEAVIKDSE